MNNLDLGRFIKRGGQQPVSRGRFRGFLFANEGLETPLQRVETRFDRFVATLLGQRY